MNNIKAVILAAGKGTRMKSDYHKVLHTVYDRAIIDYVYSSCKKAGINEIAVVTGYQREEVEKHILKLDSTVSFYNQKEMLRNRTCNYASS